MTETALPGNAVTAAGKPPEHANLGEAAAAFTNATTAMAELKGKQSVKQRELDEINEQIKATQQSIDSAQASIKVHSR